MSISYNVCIFAWSPIEILYNVYFSIKLDIITATCRVFYVKKYLYIKRLI